MRFLFLLAALTVSAVSAETATPLDPLLAKPALWTLKPEDFTSLPEARIFRWTSSTRDSARAADRPMQLFGLPVVETVVRFEGAKLAQITANIYARGDAGGISKEAYEALVKSAADAISGATKTAFTVRGKDPTSAVQAEGLIWQTPAARYLLEYSATKDPREKIPFRPEFVRLEVTPPERTLSLLTSATSTMRAKFSGPAHVKRDLVSGDVVIPDVPMVDQGQKGYCAVACMERAMRYFGLQVDENELAEVANSDSAGGTSADAMFDAVKKLSARLRLRVHPVEQFDVRQILSLIREYNLAAKKGARAPQLPDQGHTLDVSAIFYAMDPKLLAEVRTRNKGDITRFQHDAQMSVDAGVPLLWSVMLGIVPEKGIPQNAGGHMRLIIGYNQPKDEILFTDSWGPGHELKRMSTADAVTITTGLTAIEPL